MLWRRATSSSVSPGWYPQLLHPPMWYRWNSARWALGYASRTSPIVLCLVITEALINVSSSVGGFRS